MLHDTIYVMKKVNSKQEEKAIINKKVSETKKTKAVSATRSIGIASFFNSLSGVLVLLITALLPVLYFQESFLSLESAKLSFFCIATSLAAIAYLIAFALKKKKVVFVTFDILSCLLLLALVTYIISAFFSQNIFTSVWGRDFAIDSVYSVISYFIYGYLVFLHVVKDKTFVAKIVFALFATSLISSLFHVTLIVLSFFGVSLNVGILQTLLGTWTSLAIYNFIIVCLAFFITIQEKMQKLVKIVAWVVFGLNVFLLLLIAPPFLWVQMSATSLLVVVFYFLTKRKFHFAAIGMLLLGIVTLLSGNYIHSLAVNNTYVVNEKRLGLEETLIVAKKALQNNPIVGVGPAQFENKIPEMFKEALLPNAYWQRDFRYGYSYVTTLPTTVGVVGSLPWFAVPLGILFLLALSYKQKLYSKSYQHTVVFASAIVSLNLFVASLVYIPSSTILVFSSLFIAILLAISYQQELLLSKKIEVSKLASTTVVTNIVTALLAIILVFLVIEGAQKVSAEFIFQKSRLLLVDEITQEDVERSIEYVDRASDMYGVDTYYRSKALLLEKQLEMIVLNGETSETEKISALITEINRLYKASLLFDPNNYYTYVDVGNFYRSLMVLSEDDVANLAYAEAKKSYGIALSLKPDYPPIYLEVAKMEFVRNDFLQVRAALDKMLEIRPDYLQGLVYNIQFEKTRGNNNVAVRLLNNALLYNPYNPEVIILLADEQLNSGSTNVAIKTLNKLDEIGFDSTAVLLEISDILESQSRFKDAQKILQQAIKLNGNNLAIERRLNLLSEQISGTSE